MSTVRGSSSFCFTFLLQCSSHGLGYPLVTLRLQTGRGNVSTELCTLTNFINQKAFVIDLQAVTFVPTVHDWRFLYLYDSRQTLESLSVCTEARPHFCGWGVLLLDCTHTHTHRQIILNYLIPFLPGKSKLTILNTHTFTSFYTFKSNMESLIIFDDFSIGSKDRQIVLSHYFKYLQKCRKTPSKQITCKYIHWHLVKKKFC